MSEIAETLLKEIVHFSLGVVSGIVGGVAVYPIGKILKYKNVIFNYGIIKIMIELYITFL